MPSTQKSDAKDWVEGTVWLLAKQDEHTLDIHEVRLYSLHFLCFALIALTLVRLRRVLRVVSTKNTCWTVKIDGKTLSCLVYINTITKHGKPSAEYVGRINNGVRDSGISAEYVSKYIRPFVPADTIDSAAAASGSAPAAATTTTTTTVASSAVSAACAAGDAAAESKNDVREPEPQPAALARPSYASGLCLREDLVDSRADPNSISAKYEADLDRVFSDSPLSLSDRQIVLREHAGPGKTLES